MADSKVQWQLANEPIGKLIWRFSVPAVVGMLVNSIYNVIDRLYVGRCLGELGLAGISLTFPVMMVMVSFCLLIGVGTATLISLNMGRGKFKVAECLLGQSVCVFLFFTILVYPFAAFFCEPILRLFGGTEEILPYAKSYLQIIFFGSIFQYLSFGLNHTMRASGFPLKALFTMLIGAILNTILDPFFIFESVPIFGFSLPALGWGLEGAAVATVLSQIAGAIWVVAHFTGKDAAIKLKFKYVKIYPRLLKSVVSIGMALFALNIAGSVVNGVYYVSFREYAPTPEIAAREIASFGIITMVGMLVGMPVIGISQGLQPILGFNYGAQDYKRVRATFYTGLKIGGIFLSIGTLFLLLFSEEVIGLFCTQELSDGLMKTSPRELRVFFCAFWPVGIAIITGQYFQSIGKAGISMFMSLSRQLIFLLPLLLILPKYFGLDGIWWSAPISDAVSILIAIALIFIEHRRISNLMHKF